MSNLVAHDNKKASKPILALFALILIVLALTAILLVELNKVKDQQKAMMEMSAVSSKELRVEIETELRNAKTDIFKVLSKDSTPVKNSGEVTSKQKAAAARAYDLGQEAISKDDFESAMMFYINGLNHDPAHMGLIEQLVTLSLKSQEDYTIEQTINILQLSVMQTEPDSVYKVVGYIAQLQEALRPNPITFISAKEAAEKLEQIKADYALEDIWSDEDALSALFAELNNLEEELAVADVTEDDLAIIATQVKDDLSELQQVVAVYPLYSYAQNSLQQLERQIDSQNLDPHLFTSISSSFQLVMSQIWGQTANLPTPMQEVILNLPAKLAFLEKKFRKASSVKYQAELDELKGFDKDISNLKTFTQKINHIQLALKKLEELSNKIIDEGMQQEAVGLAMLMQNKNEDLTKKRYVAYQTWAVNKLHNFIKEWNDKTLYQTDGGTLSLVNSSELKTIDESLLTVEAAKVYSRAYGVIMNKLSAKNAAQMDYDLAFSPKRKIETF